MTSPVRSTDSSEPESQDEDSLNTSDQEMSYEDPGYELVSPVQSTDSSEPKSQDEDSLNTSDQEMSDGDPGDELVSPVQSTDSSEPESQDEDSLNTSDQQMSDREPGDELILKQQQQLKDYEEALKFGEVLVAYARVMMIGPGGVGKSSFLRGLMNLKLLRNAESTILADTKVVKPQFWAKAGESADSFWAEVTERDEIQELSGLLQLVATAKSGASTAGFKWPQSIQSIRDEHVPSTEDSVVRDVLEQALESSQLIPLLQQSEVPVVPKSEVLIHVWDCGGQTVFLDVLPAFLTSRTMFLLFFDARQDLLSNCNMLSYEEGRLLPKSEQSFTIIQLLSQWMASIHAMCTRKHTIFTAPSESENPAATIYPSEQMQAEIPPEHDTVNTIQKFPRIIPVGTHGDDPKAQSKGGEILNTLESHCKDKAYTPLLVDGVIVNNKTAGCGKQVEDKGFKYVREKVHEFASKHLAVRTPVAWVLFRKVLQRVAQGSPIVSYQQAVAVGQACRIAIDVVPSVLHFYHELAVFLHYTQIESLSHCIIVDPQWLIKQLGKLLAPEGLRPEIPNRLLWNPLQDKGILVQQLYEEVWQESKLKPQSLVDILEEFLLAAPIKPPTTVSPFPGRKYFIPCVLQLSSRSADSTAKAQEKVKTSSSLHLRFSTQCVPLGFFTRLATALIREPKCELLFERGIFHDKMTFAYGESEVDKIDELTILELSSSVEITVVRTKHRQLHIPTFGKMCRGISKLIQACSVSVHRWLPLINVNIAFFCEHCREKDKNHFIPIPPSSTTTSHLRCQADQLCRPTKGQQYWLEIPKTPENLMQKGDLNATELQDVAEDVQREGKLRELADALEIVPLLESLDEDTNASLTLLQRWQSGMEGSLETHSLLVYHLKCIGLVKTSDKLFYREFLSHTDPEDELLLPAPTITKLDPLNSTTLTLEWQPPTIQLSTVDGIRSWEVQYEVVGSEGRQTVEMVDPDTTALNLTVDRGTHYCVRVAGCNQEGRGSWSSDMMAETPVDPPGMPKNLTVKGVADELALKTSWDAPSDNGGRPVVSYTVQIREIAENETASNFIALTPLPVINASEVQFTYIRDSHNFHLTKNTVYEVQVMANNIAGPGLGSTARASTVDKVALETALEKERLMPLCIAQCMTVGAPQTGKSSLKRQLLKQSGQPNKSTGVADEPVVSAVTAEGSEWTVLEWEDEGAQFLQLQTLDQLPSKKPSEFPTSPSDTSDMPEHTEMLQGSHFSVGLPQREEHAQETAISVGVSTDSIPLSDSCSTDMDLSINQNEPEPSSYSDLIDTILDVGTERWIAAKKRLENQCTIYFTDTGGQLEFQEVLPAIISGPSIFFLVFNLEHAEKGLDVEFPAVYKRSDGRVYEPPPGISTFTIRDSILHILSSIQTTRCYNFKKDDKNRLIEAKVLLVGTHSDCVTDASVRKEIERDVQKLLKDTPYYQNGMLVVPCRKQPRFVYMVNNKSSEDQVFQEIREKVRSLIFKRSGDSDYKEDISAQWLVFDLMLRWPNKSKILTFKHCADLAHRCGIKEDNVEEALTFLHERFGIIRYFKGKGLGDIVITNPQVIYDMLSDLIAEKFNDSDDSLTPKQVKEFQNKGIISEGAVERITAQRRETPDLLAFLLNLLSHLHIVVKLEADEENPETKYFMPCVLAGTIQDLSASEERSEPRVADLLIVFDAGEEYCPKGLFSVLVIKLAQKPKPQKYKWVLNRKQLGRERVVFQIILYAKDLFCTYTVHIQHGLVRSRSVLRIFVEKLDRTGVHLSPENLGSVCKEIRDSVQSVIKSSLEELHKLTKFNVGFYSTCEKNQTSHKSHIGIMCIEDLCQRPYSVPQDMTCIDCDNVVCSLKEEHKVWFSEVPQVLEPRPQVLPAPTITKLEPLNSTTLTLEWQPPAIELSTLDAIRSWEVQYEVVGSEGRQTVEMVDPDTTALNLTVDRGTHYCVRVAGWNREGRGSWSSDMLAETPVDGTKPTLLELLRFTCTDGRVVSIPVEIAINYDKFGIFLLDDKNGSRVAILKHKNNDAELINIAILQEWLNGKGKQPVTWKTLVKALKDIELYTLAGDISASKCPSEQ